VNCNTTHYRATSLLLSLLIPRYPVPGYETRLSIFLSAPAD